MDFMTTLYAHPLLAGGLTTIAESLRTNWVAPLFILAVAVVALMLLKDQSWRKLIGFLGIAAVVGVLIFASTDLFGNGSKQGSLTKTASQGAGQINSFSAGSIEGIADSIGR